jgi:signal transduction histidine kinase
MNVRPRSDFIEWAFVGSLALLCATLTGLQYRWTGELARAELSRLGENLREQAARMAGRFDAELTENCTALLPTADELRKLGRDEAFAGHFQKWSASSPRPIFHRIALAVAQGDNVRLLIMDQKTGRLAPGEWPVEWKGIRENLSPRRQPPGQPPSNFDGTGAIHELPVPGDPPAPGHPPEKQRLILELDLAFVRTAWLPEIFRECLNPDGKSLVSAEVRTIGGPKNMIFASDGGDAASGEADAMVKFDRVIRDGNGPRDSGRWILQAWRRPGALEALVASARKRNMTVAALLNALILAAGIALVRHTRRSRALAETQMQFVATVSHELRTPLTVIRGAAHNLERGVASGPERVTEYAALIGQHAAQLGDMIEQMLGFAGAAKNLAPAAMQPVALGDVLREAAAAVEPETEAAHCCVELDIAPALPAAKGDAAMLRRAFQNLIVNAAKHGGSGGWIGISASATNGSAPPSIEVRVADRGRGIPEAEQARIFQPFVRGAAAQAAQVRGSGIGLSLVREIIAAHGGSVVVSSESGKGATFTVKLPAAT